MLVAVATLALTLLPAVVQAQVDVLPTQSNSKERDWQGAIMDSLKLVSLEHAIRIGFQAKTRAELDGPFWVDYAKSVRVPRPNMVNWSLHRPCSRSSGRGMI